MTRSRHHFCGAGYSLWLGLVLDDRRRSGAFHQGDSIQTILLVVVPFTADCERFSIGGIQPPPPLALVVFVIVVLHVRTACSKRCARDLTPLSTRTPASLTGLLNCPFV